VKNFEEARTLWQTYVPPRGQAETVQGELIRSVEKLRDEAQRNGNVNWRSDHETLVAFIRSTLLDSGLFDAAAETEIDSDARLLLDFQHPTTDDAPFGRLTDRIVEWSRAHPAPVPRDPDPDLHI
jgi:hypothetical protein